MNRIADILEVFYPGGLSAADYRTAIGKALELLARLERKPAAPSMDAGEAISRAVEAVAQRAAEIAPAKPSTPSQVARKVSGKSHRAAILAALQSGPMHVKDVAKRINTMGNDYNNAAAELSKLVKVGKVIRVSQGVYAIGPKFEPMPAPAAPPAKPQTPFGQAITAAIAQAEAKRDTEPPTPPREGTPGKRPPIDPHVSVHAIERYREHEPNATRDDVLRAIRYGVEIDPGVAVSMVGRNRVQDGNRYVLAPSFRGIFAIATNIRPEKVATYLRFEATQEEFARKHYTAEMALVNGGAQ